MLDKAIKYGKEHRKEYIKYAQKVDKSCRCHGSCSYCRGNRLHQINIALEAANYQMNSLEELD